MYIETLPFNKVVVNVRLGLTQKPFGYDQEPNISGFGGTILTGESVNVSVAFLCLYPGKTSSTVETMFVCDKHV